MNAAESSSGFKVAWLVAYKCSRFRTLRTVDVGT
jgi:hypothetical protein